ncbi:MAG: FAD-dependent oxidoreductase [Planctomycetaceae bacterium]|nr:FAD-dependent oxidoreductase [Planctomycetaceae bacterium]
MTAAPKTVVVIGGGVIGAACAYYLSRRGLEVTIVEQGGFGSGCSHANCGYVCPSHVLPMAAPGAVWMGLKALVARNSPLKIRPRLDPALWSWLWQFTRNCNATQMLSAGRAIQALLASSRRLYDELLAQERIECEWEAKGLLFVFQTDAAFEHYAATDELMGREFGIRARRLAGDALVAMEPALKPGLPGAWLYETDAHLRPDRLMAELKRVLAARGVTIREQCPAKRIVRENGRARAVQTPAGELAADAFVLAAGALSPRWSRELGCRMPIQPGKGYSITMPRPARCPATPMIFEEHRVGVTPFRSGYRLGSTMEFAGYDRALRPDRLELLKAAARLYLHEPLAEPVEEEWFGWRPMTPDSLPIIGASPALSNVWIAAGHNMLGLSMAPGTGRLVAELITGEQPHLDVEPYSPLRF